MRMMVFWACGLLFLLGTAACSEEFKPRPLGYHLIELPKPAYVPLAKEHPYQFEISRYAQLVKDPYPDAEDHWYDIVYPRFNARVTLTYKPLKNNQATLYELIKDSRTMIAKHQIKASGIEEFTLRAKSGDQGFYFTLSGQVPSQFQFYVTDSTRHFLRGALYFNTASKNDSLQPVIDYISADMVHLLQTLEWNEKMDREVK